MGDARLCMYNFGGILFGFGQLERLFGVESGQIMFEIQIFMRCNQVISKVNSGRETFNRHEEIIMKNSLLSLCNTETESK